MSKTDSKDKVEVDLHQARESVPASGKALKADMDTPEITLSKPIRDLIMGVSRLAHEMGGATGKTVNNLFKDYTDNMIDSLVHKQSSSDEEFLKDHNLPKDIAPIIQFGPEEITQNDLKWLNTARATLKSQRSVIPIEDTLRLLRRLQVNRKFALSESSLSDTLADLLEPSASMDLRRYMATGKSLAESWVNLLTEHRTTLTPFEATTKLHSATADLNTPVIENLKKIKHLAAMSTSDLEGIGHLALLHGEIYLRNIMDDKDITLLKLTTSIRNGQDPWTIFLQHCRSMESTLDKARLAKLNPLKTKALSTYDSTFDNSLPLERDNIIAEKDKMINSLKSEIGKIKKLQAQQQPGQYPQQPMASGPNQHTSQNSGYYRGPPAPSYNPRYGQNYPPTQNNGHDHRRAPRMADDDFRLLQGRCRLCLNHNSPPHIWQECLNFPNQTPMPRMCVICHTGAHHTAICPQRRPGNSGPQGQPSSPRQIGYQPAQPNQGN
jgi:hypothetical protein